MITPRPHRSDDDKRPSLQVKMAASMLRHGHHSHAVAEATKVPLPLVELIHEHLDTHPATSPPPPTSAHLPDRPRHHVDDHHAASTDPQPPAGPAELPSPQLSAARVLHARWRARIAVGALVGWIANLGLAAAADITHRPTLGLASLILTLILVAVMVLNVTYRPPSGPLPSRDTPPS